MAKFIYFCIKLSADEERNPIWQNFDGVASGMYRVAVASFRRMLFIPAFEDVCHSLIDNFFKVLLYHFQSFLFKTFLFSLRFILLAFSVSKCLNDLLGRIAIQVHCRVIIGKLDVPVVGYCHSFTLISIFLLNVEN